MSIAAGETGKLDTMVAPKIIYGAYPLSLLSNEDTAKTLEILKKNGIWDLDTARIYPDSEKRIGELQLPDEFTIHTKARGFNRGALTKQGIDESIKESLSLLGVFSVETFFLHCPDPDTPIEETIDEINVLYRLGKFKKFGLSNFPTADVQRIYDYAKSKSYVLPTVYQGNYNAVARKAENDLLPLLRKLGISFYAYSPIAGGFLTKSSAYIKDAKEGRFDKDTYVGQLYQKLYNRPSLLNGLDQWGKLAEKYGISKAHLAYRWVTFNSALKGDFGDAVILGGRTPEQIEDTLTALSEGSLPADICDEIDQIWELVENEAPVDNYSY